MKVDRTRLKKSASDIPDECRALIEKLRTCSRSELLEELSHIESWTFGKCELYHWIDVLDVLDTLLEEACARQVYNEWTLACDIHFSPENKKLLLWVLHFTTLLIEHSFSRHLYNSMEHLVSLLSSSDMQIVLGVLNLLYMFSKRSNFITRLNNDKRQTLLIRLYYLAESWGGKENGFGLADCCKEPNRIPPSASTLHFEFYEEKVTHNQTSPLRCIHMEAVDKLGKSPADIMNGLVQKYRIPQDKQMRLFTQLRLACCFSDYKVRMYCVQARLQALSILVYSNSLTDNLNPHFLLYNGLLEELVELLKLQFPHLIEIQSAALRTLTSIIHLDRSPTPHFPNKKPGARLKGIIEVMGASLYHGFLPTLVRSCITTLIGQQATQYPGPSTHQNFPLPLATALFSFLYHMASYEVGGKALKECGMMEALLRVIKWPGCELDHITFVTRAVRVIDLITNIDMQAFQAHGGLGIFISRLNMEINICRKEQPFEIVVPSTSTNELKNQPGFDGIQDQLRSHNLTEESSSNSWDNSSRTCCLPQRAALLKSMLNFLKKAIQEPSFAESIRHIMEGTLPASLKHIISNAEYYGPSLFLLAADVVTVYVFQEPSLLSSLQDNGLTDVVLHALLIKDVPPTREVLASLPNVFSALCLNIRGLDSFVRCRPFHRLFKVLLSPNYLTAMRRRRSADPLGDTATNLGNAMDELMRHQPTLKVGAMTAIIQLLFELCFLGSDPRYVCWRAQSKCDTSPAPQSQANSTEGGSSDEEDDDEEEASTSSPNHRDEATQENNTTSTVNNEKKPIALVEYIVNVMKFVDAILSNNSTDDHCKEFVAQDGLDPLLKILSLPNLPVDYPATVAVQSVASVCKSILNLSHEPKVLKLGLTQLANVLDTLRPLQGPVKTTTGSVLLHELANAPNLETAFTSATATPLLHAMGAAHGYVVMFVHVCRTGQTEIRSLSLQYWGSEVGLKVLRGLAELYTALVWESTLLLALCSDDIIPEGCEFGREDMEKLVPPEGRVRPNDDSSHDGSSCSMGMTSAMEALTTVENMDMEQDITVQAPTGEQKEERIISTAYQQLKYIKPLLGASSRLGRALAELFGLLVKLCVGNHTRNRRGQNIPTSLAMPTGAARRVATALNVLLVRGMTWDALPPLPVPKFRLTFLICSVGFTSPMLFDEKRYPYHLMLYKFVNLGGQAEFFNTFKWAITGGGVLDLEQGFENPNLPDGTGEFLDVWLMLLEKMCNPTAILESPHICTMKVNSQTHKIQPASQFMNFDPLKYLINIHKLAFDCIKLMWGRKPLKIYGPRMTESILTIIRHILQGEAIITEALAKKKKKLSVDTPEEHMTTMTGSSGDANPGSSTSTSVSLNSSIPVNSNHLQQLRDMGFPLGMCIDALTHTHSLEDATDYLLNNPNTRSSSAMDFGEDDAIVKAIAMSLGEINQETPKETPVEDEDPLDAKDIDKFSANILPVLLGLLDQLPDSVYSICELIFVLVKRNGDAYRDTMVRKFVTEISDKINQLINTIQMTNVFTGKIGAIWGELGSKVAIRLHLLALLIDSPFHKDMKIPCAIAMNREGFLLTVVRLIVVAEQAFSRLNRDLFTLSPKWLSPLLLVLDLTEKVAIQTVAKQKMHKSTTPHWQWYDIAVGKWNLYSFNNNAVVDAAYWKGEPTVRVTCGRRRYMLPFSDMIQVSEETTNIRPIMMSLINMNKKDKDKEDATNEARSIVHDQLVYGIDPALAETVTLSCVRLMRLPLDNETLHALMRVLLRYTRDFNNAKIFAQEGGVKLLLDLTLASNFTGFETLATLLIRHVFEAPSVLEMTMEKIIRAKSAASNFPPECRELVYLSRNLGAAIARDADMFHRVAQRVWIPDVYAEVNKRMEDKPSKEIYVRCKPSPRTIDLEITEEVTVQTISDLMIALAKPDLPSPAPSSDKTTAQNKTTAQTQPKPSTAAAATSSSSSRTLVPRLLHVGSPVNESSSTDEDSVVTLPIRKSKEPTTTTSKTGDEETKRPLIRKSDILKILSDAVKSYTIVGKYITYFVYKPEHSELITEEMTALTFLLDKLLPITENENDPERHAMTRILISSIASCHQTPETQMVLIWDIRNSLLRAINMPESAEKHVQMQMLASFVSTIIEHCPPFSNVQMKNPFQMHPLFNMGHMIRLILRRGIVADLARFTHCVDLSSPHLAATVNAALKPLEILTRVLNQPIPHLTKVPRKVSNVNDGVSLSQSGATGSEATHAQREDAPEDGDNTEADLSTVGESLERVTDHVEAVEATLVDIMDQLLGSNDHRNGDAPNADSMDIDEVGNNEQFMDRNDTEDSDSESNSSGDDDDDDDDDNDDESGRGQHVGNEESSAYEEDTEPETEFLDDDGQDLLRMIPGFERDTEDILMIQYSDQNSDTERPGRRFHWTTRGFNAMQFFHETTPLVHPLLVNRHNNENMNSSGTRNPRVSRQRRYQYLQMNSMSQNPPPIFLQRLLGPIGDNSNFSPISIMEDAPRVVIMDHNFGIFNSEEEQIDVVDQTGYLFGSHFSNGTNNLPVTLHWWNEESRMCDGSATLNLAVYFSNAIYPHLEKERNIEFEKRKTAKRFEAPSSAANKSPDVPMMETNTVVVDVNTNPRQPTTLLPNTAAGPSVPAPLPTAGEDMSIDTPSLVTNMREFDSVPGTSTQTESVSTATNTIVTTTPEIFSSIISQLGSSFNSTPVSSRIGRPPRLIRMEESSMNHNSFPTTAPSVPAGIDLDFEISPVTPVESGEEQVNEAGNVEQDITEEESENVTEESATGEETEFAYEGMMGGDQHALSTISDLDLPADVDPSFLAALPEEMRSEVIAEQLRLQRLRRSAQEQNERSSTQGNTDASTSASASASTIVAPTASNDLAEVSPDFLAALPPNIQEEVLAQQRLEQQRQLAATVNPNDPVDPAEFFQNLPPSLRQAILTDMEESQISVLPPELAVEAQNLRREWETRNRQLMQERFLSQITQSNNTLSSILRSSGRGVRTPRYTIHAVSQRSHWNSWGPATSLRNINTGPRSLRSNTVVRVRGRQLLDLESISCLLVVLFQNDPKLHVLRFHRVIRNLCYHGATREWVIKALLSILDKCVNSKPLEYFSEATLMSLSKKAKKGKSSTGGETESQNWLNINLDAALGCKTNVFLITKSGKKGVGGAEKAPTIDIHPQAAPIACRQTLELLITLAKSFPSCFLPLRLKAGQKRKSTMPKKQNEAPDFWELLLKLDHTQPPSPLKKFKLSNKSCYFNLHTTPESDSLNFTSNFEQSGFGLLLGMLEKPLVRRNSHLVDKFLRLLSMTTRGLPELSHCNSGNKHIVRFRLIEKYESVICYEEKLRTVISILTEKCCSEDGLEFALLMLLNLSQVSGDMRRIILNLLWYGSFMLSRVVDDHIHALLDELRAMKTLANEHEDDMPSSSSKTMPPGGIINDRFTKEPIIVTASKQQKTSCDLQLSSMAQLISKTSSQVYFLKMLRLIVQVLDTKKKDKNEPSTSTKPSTELDAMDTSTDSVDDEQSVIHPASGTQTRRVNSSSVDIRNFEHKPLSTILNLGSIWSTLSKCLLELEHTPDHHAVLVLQPAVEAFFLVHTPQKETRSRTYTMEDGSSHDAFATVADDIPNDDNSVIVPPLSPIHVDNAASDLFYSSDSEENRHGIATGPETISEEIHQSHPEQDNSESTTNDNMMELNDDQDTFNNAPTSNTTDVNEPSPALSATAANLIHTFEQSVSSMDDQKKFITFAERHRTVLNQILRQSTGNLAEGPFAVLVDHTRILDFDVKRRYFRSELERLDNGVRREELAIHVRRSHVFEDSFRELYRRHAEEWKNRFYIVFEEEEGQDAGGLLREWYMIISRDIFNPMYALFTVSPGDRVTYMINQSSYCNPNHLCYYKFVGRVIAKAIYDNKLLECYFTRSFYKHILGKQVKYTDMESEDYSFYKGLVYLMEHDVADLGYDLTFSTEVQEFGVTNVRDLIPHGSTVPVNEHNKMEYIRLVCQMKMTVSIQKQLTAFLEGFYDIIPKRLISIFNEQELELLISGLPNIDIDDLKNNTEYHKYQSNSLQIQWFWRALRSFDQADRAKFLQFVTGTSKVPLQGFGSLEGMNGVQKFQIHRDDRSTDRLPSAHTCFNQLDLPVYETYDKLRQNLLKAIQECSEGFGFA